MDIQLRANPESSRSPLPPIDAWKIELQLEEARAAFRDGQWAEAIETASRTLSVFEYPNVMRMDLLQVRAGGYFELGQFDPALSDLKKIETLSEAFPRVQSGFYAQILFNEIQIRLETTEASRARIEDFWEARLALGTPNFDQALSLLRLEITNRAEAGLPISHLAFACYKISEAIDDKLFSALAILDLCHGENVALKEWAAAQLPGLEKRFARIRLLVDEVSAATDSDTDAPISQSAWMLRRKKKNSELMAAFHHSATLGSPFDQAEEIDTILFLGQGLSLNLVDRVVQKRGTFDSGETKTPHIFPILF